MFALVNNVQGLLLWCGRFGDGSGNSLQMGYTDFCIWGGGSACGDLFWLTIHLPLNILWFSVLHASELTTVPIQATVEDGAF